MKFSHTKAKELCDGSKLKRSAIAAECGVRTDTLTRYLNGIGEPGLSVVKLLAMALKVPEESLFEVEAGDLPPAA